MGDRRTWRLKLAGAGGMGLWRDRGSGMRRQNAGYTNLEDLEALGETHTAGLYLEL